MRAMYSFFIPLIFLTMALTAHGELTSVAIKTEINALLDKLESSGCEFYRNGFWYTGKDAKAHLLNKLGFIENKTVLKNTEAFIELAASTSSFSGKAYEVRCHGKDTLESGEWMRNELKALRAIQ